MDYGASEMEIQGYQSQLKNSICEQTMVFSKNSICEQTMFFSSKNESSLSTVYADILLYGWYVFFKPIFHISNSLYMKYLFCKKSVFFYR